MTSETLRRKQCTLGNSSLTVDFIDNKFQPRTPGHQHFCAQPQNVRRVESLNAPEVQGFTFDQVSRVTSTERKDPFSASETQM